MDKTFFMVRHGSTADTERHRLTGGRDSGTSIDIGLTPAGLRQTAALAFLVTAYTDISVIITAPMRRTIETANALNRYAHLPVIVEPALREWNLGNATSARDFPQKILLATGWKPRNGEARREFEPRMRTAAKHCIENNATPLIVVGSNGWRAAKREFGIRNPGKIEPGQIIEAKRGPRGWRASVIASM